MARLRRHAFGRMQIVAALALLMICYMHGAGFAANHYVTCPNGVEPYEWIYGCSPTSAAMALSYWDYYVPGEGKYTWYGNLIDYYVDVKEPKYGDVHNVPNTIVQLRDAMGTNKDTSSDDYGNTSSGNIHTGITTVTNSVNHYNFSSNQHGCSSSSCDWLWGTITNEIGLNRPFVWSVCTSGGGGQGHSTAAIGYTDDKYVIIYNTWDTAKHWWKYNQYNNTWAANYVQVDTVEPGGGTGPTEGQDILLDTPNGGETYTGGQTVTVWWYQWGSRINTVKLYYYYGGEYSSPNNPTFHYIATRSSSEDWNSYSWTVPNVSSTKKMRLKINGKESSTGVYLAKDGSSNDFTVIAGTGVPTNVIATNGTYTAKVRVTWDSVSGASYYRVYRATSSGGTKTTLGSWQTSRSYDDTSATAGTTYYYWVKAATSSSGSNPSDYSSYNTGWRGLSPPTGVSASDGTYTAKVRVTWGSVSGASYYRVYRATSSGGTKTTLGSWQTSRSYDDTSATAGTTYYYWVKAATSNSGSRASNYSSYNTGWRKLSPPTGVSASDGTHTDKVYITWNSVTGASYYRVYRATSSGGTKTALGSWQTSRSYDDTSATAGTTYYYWVKAATSSSGSRASNYSSYNTGWRKLSPPTGVSASDGTHTDKVYITWNSVTGASYYRVYRATSSGGTKTALGSWQTSRSYDDTTATPGYKYYYYWVKAATNSSGSRASNYSSYNTGWRATDTTPPTPNPMTWSTNPYAMDSSVAMVATTATDPSGVEYYFDETTSHAGGTDSGWQSSPSYTDSGLSAGTQYCYRVKARDKSSNHNETGWSSTKCTYTGTSAKFRVTKEGDVLADGSFYGAGFHSGSADVAEWVSVSEPVEPGDVLELDPDHAGHYRKSRGPCSTLVAGVVSTNPGFVLGSPLPTDDSRLATEDSALLALIGIVPVKVSDEGGPIEPGDLLVSSSTPGYAMRWNPESGEACGLIGKALEPLDSGTGVIQVLLMR